MLRSDSVASRIESISDAHSRSAKSFKPRSVSVSVRAGSLWQRLADAGAADDTYEPIAVVRNSSSVVLRSCEQENVCLTCTPSELHRLNSEIECQLLLAIEIEDERLRIIDADDGHQLKIGRQLWATWKDQQQGRSNHGQAIVDVIKVLVYGNIWGSLRYVGHVHSRLGLWFGVELSNVSAILKILYWQLIDFLL